MIKIAKIRKTISENVIKYFCDECGNEIKPCYKANCKICGKDLHLECIGQEVNEIGGDYSTYYCKSCWEKGEFYRKEIEILEEKIYKLTEEWENNCKHNNI